MSCDIIIPVFNQDKYTKECLASIKANTDIDYRIIFVDDNSNDADTVKFLGAISDKNIKILRNEQNLGWVKSVNRGLEESGAEYVCIMNNDTIVSGGWLPEMIAVAEKEADIGLVNPEWEKPEKISISDYAAGRKRFRGEYIETDWVRGFCFLVKREVLNKIGGLDEAYSPGCFDDCDFSMRAIKEGFRCVRAKAAYVYHYRNISYKAILKDKRWNELLEAKKQLFYRRWGRPLRLVFIFTEKIVDKKVAEDMLYSLARKQHHLYIWALSKDVPLVEHTNVRINFFPKVFFSLFATFGLLNNLGRNIAKKYNAIFLNESGIFRLFLLLGLDKKINIFLRDFNSIGIGTDIIKQVENIKNERKIDGGYFNQRRGR